MTSFLPLRPLPAWRRAGMLGFRARDAEFAGARGTVRLETASGTSVGLMILPWASRPSLVWRDLVWPVAVYAKGNIGIFESRLDEANGASEVGSGSSAAVTILDLGVMQSLMFQNTRGTGRKVGRSSSLSVWEELPPESRLGAFVNHIPRPRYYRHYGYYTDE